MPEERVIDLIQRDIDGDTTPEEQAELRDRLERDVDSRIYYDGIRHVAAALEATPASEPPANFTLAVMSGIREQAARTSNAERFRRPRDRFLAVRVGIGLAAAALLAVVLAPSLFRALDSSHLRGTMIAPAVQSQTVTAGPQSVAIESKGRRVSLRFDAPAASGGSADITFDSSVLRVESVEGATRSDPSPGNLHLTFDGPASVVFERATTTAVTLSLRVHDQSTTHSRKIEIPATTNF
jgi:hypothetical protein